MTRPRRSRCLSSQSLKDVEKTFLGQSDMGNTGSIREEDTYQRKSVLGAADAEIWPTDGYKEHIRYTEHVSRDLSSAQPMQRHLILYQ